MPQSIDEFRTARYRVLSSPPYFNMNLEEEIEWHKQYIKRLHHHKKKPSVFHRSLTSHKIDQNRIRHFKEHVLEAIPFHRERLEVHQKRLRFIEKVIPDKIYKKLVRASMHKGLVPEYFVYDKKEKEFFFVAEHDEKSRKEWIQRTKRIVKTIILDSKKL